ncbi:hypothetical protein [Ruegeria atlantica]|uniref:hypothetical protein n=1 Tax=Ruegeria atlantica TaxID=81569 RepID=UPI0024947837|nr:hypothetical protein [Ruegeria atlantica]
MPKSLSRRSFISSTLSTAALAKSTFLSSTRPASSEAMTAMAVIGVVAQVGNMLVGFMKKDPASSIMQAQYQLLQAIVAEVRAINVQLQNISAQIEQLYKHVYDANFAALETELYAGMASAWMGFLEKKASKSNTEERGEYFDNKAYYSEVYTLYQQFADFRRRLILFGEREDFRGIAHIVVAQELEQSFVLELTSLEAFEHSFSINLRDGEEAGKAYLKYFETALDSNRENSIPKVEVAAAKRYDAAKNNMRPYPELRDAAFGEFSGDHLLICSTGRRRKGYKCSSNNQVQPSVPFNGWGSKSQGEVHDAGWCYYYFNQFTQLRLKLSNVQVQEPIIYRQIEFYDGPGGEAEGSLNKFPAYLECKKHKDFTSKQDKDDWEARNIEPMRKAVAKLNIAEADFYGAKALREAVELAQERTKAALAAYCLETFDSASGLCSQDK